MRAARSAARQPVVHQDDPADADHRAEAEGEVLDGAEAAVEPFALGRHQNFSRSSEGAAIFLRDDDEEVVVLGIARW